jgi:hypothetical protein
VKRFALEGRNIALAGHANFIGEWHTPIILRESVDSSVTRVSRAGDIKRRAYGVFFFCRFILSVYIR